MALGPGKYDDVATTVMFETQAKLVLIAVVDGNRGQGFACQCSDVSLMRTIPEILRTIADQLEDDVAITGWEEKANDSSTVE
jgi:hypothetical protein